jgi:antitoxin VapB
MRTRIFKSGNSLAVRIPKELAFDGTLQEVEIERRGDSLIIRPLATRSQAGVAQAFSAFPPDFMAEGRDVHEQKERDWDREGT